MKFSVNIDHIATLRNARAEIQPDPVTAALLAEQAGVDGIVVHLREDRRHINDRDLKLLRELITTRLDLEMAATEEIIGIACETLPDLVTLVPEKRQELTTEGGINVIDNFSIIADAIAELHKFRIPVSLFIEPSQEHIEAAIECKTDFIEIHTGIYANCPTEESAFDELERVRQAAKFAKKHGLGVNAGHGLNYKNMKDFRELTDIDEVSIGHAIIARAVLVGLPQAIKDMLNIIKFGF
ncbi:MAG: pyridoxine 5'-phosphate synthase [Ignavibacteriales bacterium]|nr:pyridoxine 5'-phosphate synthase [Ignavibacteriales bacterium]